MAVTADVVKVVLEGEVDGYNADIKQSVSVFEGSMTKMERAAVRTEKTVSTAMTRTAKLTNQQLMTVQYTVNDVIASLSSGGNPLTILAQQGGQVTQAFGGLSGTLKTLGPIAFSAGGALTGFGVALGAAVFAADRFDASNKALLTSVTGLGLRAGLTVDELKSLAAAAAEAGNVSTSASESMAQAYLNTGRIGGDVIGKLIAVTDDYAHVTGQDATKAADDLAKIMSDRTGRAALELLDRFGALDAKTQTLIQTLYANGDVQGAQVVVVNRLSDAIAGQADNVGFLTKAWRGLKNAIGSAGTASRDFFSRGTQVEDAFSGFGGGRQTSTQQAASSAAATAARIAREDRAKAANAIIDDVTGAGRRRELEGERAKINAALKDGTINAQAGAAALKKLKEDIDTIGAGPKASRAGGRQPTQAQSRESAARADGRFAMGSGVDRGVQSIDVQTIRGLEKLFVSRGGLEEYIRQGGSDFKAAGTDSLIASEQLQRSKDDLYDATYDSIATGLEAGFRDGLPGVLEFFSQELQRSLIHSLATALTDAITQSGGGGGNIFSAIRSAIFGRANGGNIVGGRPYLINEGRPEVFVPPMSGKMVPVSRMGAGSTTISPTVNMKVDLTGANGDATIVRIARQAAIQAGQQAYQQAMRDAPAAVAKRQEERG